MLKSIIRLPRLTDVYSHFSKNIADKNKVIFSWSFILLPHPSGSSVFFFMGNLSVIALRIIIADKSQIIKVLSSMIFMTSS